MKDGTSSISELTFLPLRPRRRPCGPANDDLRVVLDLKNTGGAGGLVRDLPHQQLKGVPALFGKAGVDGGQADVGKAGGENVVEPADRAVPRDGAGDP